MSTPDSEAEKLREDIKQAILTVLSNDPRPMPLNVLTHKVFKNLKDLYPSTYIQHADLMSALEELIRKFWVGKNQFNKYFIDYLDWEEKENSEGEGYIDVDPLTGNGYITIKRNFKEYRKSSHFVHKKNLNGAKHGDYVRFMELNITDKKFVNKFALIDVVVKEILPKPSLES